MTDNSKYINNAINKIPLIGIITSMLLFVYAAALYPGGSVLNSNSVGFDWMNNYWCNLTSLKAINGQTNFARPVAISAMILLSSVLLFSLFNSQKFIQKTFIGNGL